MRIPIPKYLALWLIASFLAIDIASAQCNPEVDYSVQKKSENSYSIYLKSPSASTTGVLKVRLYDLFTGKISQEKEIHSLGLSSQEVFQNVPPSKYSIIITLEHCEKPTTLGGINGINVGIPG